MSVPLKFTTAEIDKMKKLLKNANYFRSSGLEKYKLSTSEEKELKRMVTERLPFLKGASMDAIIDNGLLLVGADSILGHQKEKEGSKTSTA
jgi:hypothetical protein